MSRAELAFEVLKKAIVSGVLPPGASIIEDQVATDLGLSRTPVREALRMLEVLGLITVRGSRGVEVRGFNGSELRQLNQVRILLEGEAVAQACKHAETHDFTRARSALERLENPAHTPGRQYRSAHKEFHRAIYELADNPFLLKAIDPLLDMADLAWEATAPDLPRYETAQRNHRAILAAIESGDSLAATNALRDHIVAVEDTMLQQLEQTKAHPRAGGLKAVLEGVEQDLGLTSDLVKGD